MKEYRKFLNLKIDGVIAVLFCEKLKTLSMNKDNYEGFVQIRRENKDDLGIIQG